MNTQIELVRVVVTKNEVGGSFAYWYQQNPFEFWYANGQVTLDWRSLFDGDKHEFKTANYSIYVDFLKNSWDCQLHHEVEGRGVDDTIAHDVDAFLALFEKHTSGNRLGLVAEFLLAYEVSSWVHRNNYGDKDACMEYELLGEIDLSKLPLAIVPIAINKG